MCCRFTSRTACLTPAEVPSRTIPISARRKTQVPFESKTAAVPLSPFASHATQLASTAIDILPDLIARYPTVIPPNTRHNYAVYVTRPYASSSRPWRSGLTAAIIVYTYGAWPVRWRCVQCTTPQGGRRAYPRAGGEDVFAAGARSAGIQSPTPSACPPYLVLADLGTETVGQKINRVVQADLAPVRASSAISTWQAEVQGTPRTTLRSTGTLPVEFVNLVDN